MDSIGNLILYFVAAVVMVVFSVMAVRARRILRAATYLLFVLLSTGIFYFQLGYQFLGAVQIAVYAGGIMVLFVFSILLTAKPGENTPKLESHRKAVGIVSSVLGAIVLLYALFNMPFMGESTLAGALSGDAIDMKAIGHTMLGTDRYQYLLPFEAVSVLLLACIIGGVVVARKK